MKAKVILLVMEKFYKKKHSSIFLCFSDFYIFAQN